MPPLRVARMETGRSGQAAAGAAAAAVQEAAAHPRRRWPRATMGCSARMRSGRG